MRKKAGSCPFIDVDSLPTLGRHVDCCLCTSLVDPDWLTVELGELLGSKLQTAWDGVFVSVLNHAVDVLLGATWNGSALAHAHIDNEAALVLMEEFSNNVLLVERGSRQWCNPDGAINVLLGEKVDTFEVVNVDLASQVGCGHTLVELYLVELGQEIVLYPKFLQLLLATCLRKNKLLK